MFELLIIILLFCSLFMVLYHTTLFSSITRPITEGYEYDVISYCEDCKNKTFGQCTQCASCVWVRGVDYEKGQMFAECRKGDEHGVWRDGEENQNSNKKIVWQYSRDPFYDGPYESMIAQ